MDSRDDGDQGCPRPSEERNERPSEESADGADAGAKIHCRSDRRQRKRAKRTSEKDTEQQQSDRLQLALQRDPPSFLGGVDVRRRSLNDRIRVS